MKRNLPSTSLREPKTVLMLGAGPLQVPAIVAGRRMGLRIVAADGSPAAPGLALADAAHVLDIADPQACLRLARAERIDGVLHICSEVAMSALGLINRELGLHGPGPDTTRCATDKIEMRRAFARGAAPSPESIPVRDEIDAIEAVRTLGGRLVVKPSRNSGSRGVTYLPADVAPERTLEAARRALGASRDGAALVERYVDGPEFSVEAFVWNGRIELVAITDKITTGTPHFVEIGHTQPTQLPAPDASAVRAAAERGIRALGLDWCAAHVEVRLSCDGPVLIEIGARLGGDYICTELVARSAGIDMVTDAIRLCLGEAPALRASHLLRGAAIRYLVAPPGRVGRITGIDQARAMPGVAGVEVYVSPGDTVAELDSSLARAGHVIAEGSTAAEAAACAERALALLKVTHG